MNRRQQQHRQPADAADLRHVAPFVGDEPVEVGPLACAVAVVVGSDTKGHELS